MKNMKQPGIFLFLLSLATTLSFAQAKVLLLPTIHSLHKSNDLYTYDSLKRIVQRANSDVIIVEIRSMDVNADTNYLSKNYPYEMWMMRYWFPQATIEGFDWLGKELEGKPIPAAYWQQQSEIKKLERQLDKDSVYGRKFSACQQYTQKRLPILKNKSLHGILRSEDGLLIQNYYDCMKQQLEGSIYQKLPDFYMERNRQMEIRLKSILQKYPDKTVVVLTGDDHYPYLLEYLKKAKIQLLEP
jgi:hypothetical protein